MNKTNGLNNWPSFTKEEAEAVQKILLSNRVNYWTGEECLKFEKEFSKWSDTKFSIALSNGSVALDLALKAIGINEKDEVIVTPRSFIASVSCAINAGAKPVFADVCSESGNIEARTIESAISSKTKAVICVHLNGRPCDMNPIMRLSKKHNFYVIEDCAQAHGAKYNGKSVGSIGHIGAWSFCQDKIMTTGGEGGMATTNDKKLWEKMWAYKDHGKSLKAVYKKNHPPGYRWLHESFGTNYRMTEMQAAIGRIQLKKMHIWHKLRTDNAKSLTEVCNHYPNMLQTPDCLENSIHAFYKLNTYIKPEGLKKGWSRDKIIREINKLGVPCFSGSCSEIYLESAFDNTTFKPKGRLGTARLLGETSLVFLVHPTLTKDDLNKITKVMHEVFKRAASD